MDPEETFCVVCGKTGVELFGALCADCLGKKIPPVSVPPQVRVTVCPFCGSRLYGRHWEKGPPPGFVQGKDLDGYLTVHRPFELRSIAWEEGGQNPKLRQYTGLAVVALGATTREVHVATEVKIVNQVCPTCARRGGKFYTAKVQLRAEDTNSGARPMVEFRQSVATLWEHFLSRSPKSWSEAISWEEVLKEGIDVYFTETSVAKVVAKELRGHAGGRTKESASLWGVKDGRQIYRTTILLRLPSVLPGDFLVVDGRLVQIRRRVGERLQWADVGTGEVGTRKVPSDTPPGRIVGGPSALRWAESIPGDDSHVIDPVAGERLQLVNPLGAASPEPSEVPIVRDGNEAWWTPRLSPRKLTGSR